MKKNSWSVVAKCFILAGLILSFSIMGISLVYSQEKDNPCQLGDLYLEAGKIDKAEDFFADLLKSNPKLPCAISGMKKVISQRELLLQEYCDSKNYDMTWPLFDSLLAQSTSDPTIQKEYYGALTAVAPTPEPEETPSPSETPTISSYEIAEALKELGRPDLAYLQIQTAIAEDPLYFMATEAKTTDVIETSTTEDDTKDETQSDVYEGKLKRSFYVWVEKAKAAIIEFLEFIGVLLAGGLSVYYLIRMLIYHFCCKFDIGDFTEGVDISCKPKEGFQALVEREIWRLSSRNGLKERDIVYQPLQDIDLSSTTLFKLGEISQVMKILNFIFPPRLVVLTGTLHYSSKKGAGVTLQIVLKKNRIIDEITLWQSEYDPQYKASSQSAEPEYFYRLAEPSALWLAWHLQTNFNGQYDCGIIRCLKRIIGSEKRNRLDLRKNFGTDNINSYLLNYIASKYMEKDLVSKDATDYLLKSYYSDPNNRLTLFNMANQKIAQISEEYFKTNNPPDKKVMIDYEEPKKLLEKIERLSWNVTSSIPEQDTDSMLKEVPLEKVGKEEVIDSIRVLTKYHLGALHGYLYILKDFPKGKSEDFENYKKYYLECAQILEKLQDIENIKHKMLINYELKEMIQAAIDGMHNFSSLVKNEGETEKLIEIQDKNIVISASLAYNWACNEANAAGYLNSLDKKPLKKIKEHIAKAKKYLAIAIRNDPSLETWSKSDPDLNPLWKLKSKSVSPPQPNRYKYPRSLEDIFGISPVYVAKLKAISGMLNSDDLLKAGAEESGRVYIHRRTKLPLDLIEEWVKLADLMRVEWIDGSHAKLLLASGVDSVIKLKRQDAKKLLSLIGKTNKEYAFSNQLPSVEELKEWISSAQKLEILFEEN